MKNKIFTAIILGIITMTVTRLHAAPGTQDVGSISTGNVVTVNVSSNPTLVLSTGAFNSFPNFPPFNYSQFPTSSTLPVAGDYLPNRIGFELTNDSTIPIFCAFDVDVATTGRKRGKYIRENGGTWSIDGSVPCIYCVAPSSTGFLVTAAQSR